MSRIQDLAKELVASKKLLLQMEKTMEPAKEKYESLRVALELEMGKEGTKEVATEGGKVQWVDKRGRKILNEKAIAKALGVSDLDEYKTEGKPTHYVLVSVNKELV